LSACMQSTMTIERQLQLFSEYKAKVGGIHERALFVVCSGSNDIVEHFTLADGMTSPEYADMMARRAIGLVEVGVLIIILCIAMQCKRLLRASMHAWGITAHICLLAHDAICRR
jgi:hypothetical protein